MILVVGIDPGQNGAQAARPVIRLDPKAVPEVGISRAPWIPAVTSNRKKKRKAKAGYWDLRAMVLTVKSWMDAVPDGGTLMVLLEAPAMGLKAGVISGLWRGVLAGFLPPYRLDLHVHVSVVPSARWKKALGLHGRTSLETTGGKRSSASNKAHRDGKVEAVALCQRLYPQVSLQRTARSTKPDDNIAEAVLIAHYGATVLLPTLLDPRTSP